MKEKACQQMSFTDWFWKVSSPNGLSVLLARRKKGKIMLPVCLLSAVSRTRVINGKIIEDEASHNFWRFLAEDFFLPVIKPLGTYFNNKLLPSCRSSFAATSVLLCAPLDPIRLDRNSKSAWRRSVFIFLRQTLHWKWRRAATFLIK